MTLGIPQVILLVLMIISVLFVPANDEKYWTLRYSLISRLLRFAVWFALLWWGGFWG